MPLISKPNYNQIFASQAPEQDKPAVFNNYPEGWGTESRPNNGKPTIKGFNYLQQTSDLKDLWILQNGACLPYDESIEYAEGAPVLKDGVIQYKTADGFKSRDAVTIPTYNNAADGVDPVTGVADGVYFNVRSTDDDTVAIEYQNVGGSAVATGKSYPTSEVVQEISNYTALPFKSGKSYALYERVQLDSGDVVQSTVANNTANPNEGMTGWEFEGKSKAIYNPLNLNYTEVQLATAFTSSLNALINKVSSTGGGTISIPDGEFSINPSFGGVVLKDSVHLVMGRGTVLKNINSTATTYQIIRADGVVDASISGGTLDGNKAGNPSTTGEQGHGIYIKGGRNISINDVNVKDTWGDGVYIGRLSSETPINDAIPRNIKLSNVTVDGARRQGLTVITVDGCTVDNFTAKNINGTNPKAGVDIEPNNSDEYIKGLVFNNLVTENTAAGLVVNCLAPVFADVTSDKQVIDVTINGHIDNNSNVAVGFSSKNGYVKGRVLVNNANYRGQTGYAISSGKHADGIELTIVDPNVELTDNTSDFVYIRGIVIGDTAIPIGGLSIIRPNFKRSVTSDRHDFNLALHSSFSATGYKNISIIDPERVNSSNGQLFGEGKPITNFSISDIHNVSKNVITDNATDANYGYSRTIALSNDVTSNVTYRFNSIAKGRKIRLVNESTSFNFVISFHSQIAVKGLVNTRSYSKELLITIKPGGFIDIDAIDTNSVVIKEIFNCFNNYDSDVRTITSATLITAGNSTTYSNNVPLLDSNNVVLGVLSPKIDGVTVDCFAVDGVVTTTVKNTTAASITIPISSTISIIGIN